jgi:hypothetical protein
MPQLFSFRKGWESENLARYLLHKFSFIANPSTISDDIGCDYYCTTFDIEKSNGHDFLIPINSFTIQIKSSPEIIDITDKIQYLHKLELPYFVGVVDRSELSLTFYSGEFIPPLFSYVGIPKYLELDLLCKGNPYDEYNFSVKLADEKYRMRFPIVTKITATQSDEEFWNCVKIIKNKCLMMYKNIVSKMNEEYIFKFKTDQEGLYNVMGFAGVGSIRHFRNNLIERLGEAFNNLLWILGTNPERFDRREFEIYKRTYLEIREMPQIFGVMPRYIEEYFQNIDRRV